MSLFVDKTLRKAERHARRGEIELAVQHYNSVLEKFPQNKRATDGLKALQLSKAVEAATTPTGPQEQLNGLIALYNQGKLQEVLALGETLGRQYPALPVIPTLLGAANAGLGRLEKAIASYEQALQIDPEFAEAHNNLGAVLNDLGQPGEAIASLTKAIEIMPNFAVAHNNLGNALKNLGRPEDAIASFDKALQIQPDYAEAHNNLGNTFYELGKPDEAVTSLSKALHLAPSFAVAHNNLGNAFRDLGRPDEAVRSYKKALQIKPGFPEAHNNLGNALNDLGMREEAVASFDKALQLQPDFAGAHRNLSATRKYQASDPQIRQMRELIERPDLSDDDRMQLHFALGKVYDDTGDHDTAFSHLLRGNRLLREKRKYDASATEASFAQIKSWFAQDVPALPGAGHTGGEKGRKPIFILGMPRSGTTLVEQILASHSQVYGAGELRLLERSMSAIEQDASERSRAHLESVRRSYLAGLAKLGASETCITDKMPFNFRWIGIICTAMPEAKIVHVKRDARATCWSVFKHYFSRSGHGFANDIQDVANYYKLYIDLMAYWHEHFPGRIYDLHYEVLTECQEVETRKLLEYVDLPWEEQCLEFHKTKRAVQTSSVTQVRRKMYQGSSDAWRNYEKNLEPMVESLSSL